MAGLDEYLTQMAELQRQAGAANGFSPPGRYASLEELVLREGRLYERVLSAEEHGYEPDAPKECFKNAALLALMHTSLTYTEGYASFGLMGVHHAWCVTGEGEVIDTTWSSLDGDHESLEYRGIEMSDELLRRVLTSREMYGVLDDYQSGFPALRLDPFSTESLLHFYS